VGVAGVRDPALSTWQMRCSRWSQVLDSITLAHDPILDSSPEAEASSGFVAIRGDTGGFEAFEWRETAVFPVE
jgi:hypothetical protein